MTPRQRRMTLVVSIVAGVAIAAFFVLRAFQDNVMFYFDPTKVANGEVRVGQKFTLGGMVVVGSLARTPGTMEVRFKVTDFNRELPVIYTGVLPNLFRENSGMVAEGRLNDAGVFMAERVLAKHDEKYMPPALKKSLDAGAQAAGSAP